MVLDLIIIACVVIATLKWYRHGLIRSVLSCFSRILSTFSAIIIAKRYAGVLSEKFVYNTFYKYINEYVSNKVDTSEIVKTLTENIVNPDSFISNFLLNMSTADVETLLGLDTDSAVTFLTQNIAESVSYGFTYVTLFIISLIVVSIAFNLVLKFVEFILNITALSLVNKIVGGIVGGFSTYLIFAVIIWTTISVIPLTTAENGMFSEEKIKDTYITQFIVDTKPQSFSMLIN